MTAIVLFLAVLAVSTHAYEIRRLEPITRAPIKTDSIPPAQFLVPLTEKVPRSTYKKELLSALYKWDLKGSHSHTATLAGATGDNEYVTGITIGGQNFKVVVDTGSSDTWVVKKGFKCYNLTRHPEPQSTCAFGSSGFKESESNTFVDFPNTNFNTSYGSGEFLIGPVGFETVTVGGLTVTHQEIGFPAEAGWVGDNVTSGILGLAYPSITSVFDGTNPNKDSITKNHLPYNPFFYTAVSEKAVSNPFFSITLNRGSLDKQNNSTYDPNLGYLAFGGTVPVPTTSPTVTVPVQGFNTSFSKGAKAYVFYAVDVEAYIYSGVTKQTNSSDTVAILDTGTTLNYLPKAVAKAYNSRFIPPAHQVESVGGGLYVVACNATAPDFELQIGGKKFNIDPRDQILGPAYTNVTSGEIMCFSGTQSNEGLRNHLVILGDVFLHNVITTFNIKSNQITLTQRAPY